MQVITTKFLGATDFKPARIKATHTGRAKSVTVSVHSNRGDTSTHSLAAKALALKLGWHGEFVSGTPHGSGDVRVWVNTNAIAERFTIKPTEESE